MSSTPFSSSPCVALNTGLQMPLLGLGTYKLCGLQDVHRAVDAALCAGYRAFDSAAVYRNEAELGKALRALLPKYGLTREDVFITRWFYFFFFCNLLFTSVKLICSMQTFLSTLFFSVYLVTVSWALRIRVKRPWRGPSTVGPSWTWITLISTLSTGPALKDCRWVTSATQVEFHPRLCQPELMSLCKQYGVCFQAYSSLGKGELLSDPVMLDVAKNCKRTPAQAYDDKLGATDMICCFKMIHILILTPLSSRLTNSSLILRSCRPYFLAAHRAGGAELDRFLNENPSVGVPASSSPLASSSSPLEMVEAWDSEFSLMRPFAGSERVKAERGWRLFL
ncbi:hypothetical protein XENOCAPTIV_009746 [Xenoophorus captivus]|uniref:NADP-dependent oxidoreductase domain-containing protein n=1 Tax=Xenoophorus captivus TaxID=1517983 RepID=A0ABV0RKD9_9TELE